MVLSILAVAVAFWAVFVVGLGMPLNPLAQVLLLVAGGAVGLSFRTPRPVRAAKGVVAGLLFVVGLLLLESFTLPNGPPVLDAVLRLDLSTGSGPSRMVIEFTWGFLAGVLVDHVG